MNYFGENIELIQQKWPSLADILVAKYTEQIDAQWLPGSSDTIVFQGIQQGSNYDAQLESSLQCQHLPKNVTHVQVFGIGLGYAIENLLNRKSIEQLDVYIFNFQLFCFSLKHIDFRVWLSDPRVNLCYSNKMDSILSPFIALPGELATAEEQFASLRDRVCLELDHQYISENNGGNSPEVIELLESNKYLISSDGGLDELSSLTQLSTRIADKEINYVIAAAGPSLSDHYQWLKRQKANEQIILIAVDAAVQPLLLAGIIPDIVVSIDKVSSKLFKELDIQTLKNVPLVYFPLLDNHFLKSWPGPRFVFLSSGGSFDEQAKLLGCSRLYCSGSVIHPSIDLARKLSARNILMLGADFSLIRDKTHVSGTQIVYQESVLSQQTTPHWLLNGHGEKVPTYLNFRGYLRDLEQYIKLYPTVNFFNGSLDGAAIIGVELWHEFSVSNEEGYK